MSHGAAIAQQEKVFLEKFPAWKGPSSSPKCKEAKAERSLSSVHQKDWAGIRKMMKNTQDKTHLSLTYAKGPSKVFRIIIPHSFC